MSLSVLQDLRARIGTLQPHRDAFPYSELHAGLPRGVLVEISGHGKTEKVVRFLAENPDLPVAWVEENLSIFPTAVLQRNVDLDKILFIDGKEDSSWAANTVLRSRLFPVVVYHAPYGEIRDLRRWQLLAERAHATMILLREDPCLAWPISLHLRCLRGELEVLKRR